MPNRLHSSHLQRLFTTRATFVYFVIALTARSSLRGRPLQPRLPPPCESKCPSPATPPTWPTPTRTLASSSPRRSGDREGQHKGIHNRFKRSCRSQDPDPQNSSTPKFCAEQTGGAKKTGLDTDTVELTIKTLLRHLVTREFSSPTKP
eukprot:9480464-Pyramimonas_sp.AAC.2